MQRLVAAAPVFPTLTSSVFTICWHLGKKLFSISLTILPILPQACHFTTAFSIQIESSVKKSNEQFQKLKTIFLGSPFDQRRWRRVVIIIVLLVPPSHRPPVLKSLFAPLLFALSVNRSATVCRGSVWLVMTGVNKVAAGANLAKCPPNMYALPISVSRGAIVSRRHSEVIYKKDPKQAIQSHHSALKLTLRGTGLLCLQRRETISFSDERLHSSNEHATRLMPLVLSLETLKKKNNRQMVSPFKTNFTI